MYDVKQFPVECYSGSRYAERPKAFYWEGSRLEVEAVDVEQRTPSGRFFRVRTWDKGVYDLIYDEVRDDWQVKQVS